MLYQPSNQIMSNQTCMHGGQRSKENKPGKGGVGEEPPPGTEALRAPSRLPMGSEGRDTF